jgi:fatty acid desaturase
MITEHAALQSARAAATTESTGRTTIFVGSVTGGLIALGLIASATRLSTGFYVLGVIVLLTLAVIGFTTFDWVLQSGIEDHHYAERIEQLRARYLDIAPELSPYLASVASSRRLAVHGSRRARWRVFRTAAGMIGLVTAIMAGSAAGLFDAAVFGRSVVHGFIAFGLVAVAVLTALLWFERRAWKPARRERIYGDEQE